MPTHSSRLPLASALFRAVLATTALLTAACSEDPGPGTLFDEEGTWALTSYTLTGSGIVSVETSRSRSFLLNFDKANNVVQTAMCATDPLEDPDNASCSASGGAEWFCSCYGYDFEENVMAWQEFQPGNMPPIVKVGESTPAGGGGGDTDTDGGSGGDEPVPAGGVHELNLTEFADIADTYDFTSLPAGIFGSDGAVSKFVFVRRATNLFDRVLDDPDGRPSCQPCI